MVERRGTRIKGGKEREREKRSLIFSSASPSIGEGSPRTLFSRSLSLSLSLFSNLLLVQRELASSLLELLALSIRSPSPLVYPAAPAEASYGSFAPLRCLRLYTFSLSLSPCLSVFLSVGARSREPATGRINSHARVSVAVSVHGPLLPPSHLVPFPFSPSLLSFLLPSLLP